MRNKSFWLLENLLAKFHEMLIFDVYVNRGKRNFPGMKSAYSQLRLSQTELDLSRGNPAKVALAHIRQNIGTLFITVIIFQVKNNCFFQIRYNYSFLYGKTSKEFNYFFSPDESSPRFRRNLNRLIE